MLTGQRPFQGGDRAGTLDAVVKSEPRAPRVLSPAIHGEVERVVLRCLSKEAGARFQTMADVESALDGVASKPVRRSWIGATAAADVLILVAVKTPSFVNS